MFLLVFMLLFSIFFLLAPEIPTARIARIGTGKTENRKYRVFLKPNIEIFPVLNISTQHYLHVAQERKEFKYMLQLPKRLPKPIQCSQLKEGLHCIGRLRLRFKDTVKRKLKDEKISIGSWQSVSSNRCQWRDKVHKKSLSDTKDSQ